MTNGLREPFVVTALRGKLIPTFSPDWAENGQALLLALEIQGNGLPQTRVAINPDGTFNHPVPEGRYCFRLSSEHFQGYAGTIVVSRSAAPEAEIELRIHMGV